LRQAFCGKGNSVHGRGAQPHYTWVIALEPQPQALDLNSQVM
jgi:hypothetical protein